MSVDFQALSQLSSSTYNLKLLEQNLETVKLPSRHHTPELLSPFPPDTKQKVYDSTKIMEVAIATITSFQEHIKDFPPTAMAQTLGTEILDKALSELKKVEEILERISFTEKKPQLTSTVQDCEKAILNAITLLQTTPSQGDKTRLNMFEEGLASLGTLGLSVVDVAADEARFKTLIEEKQTVLYTLTGSKDAEKFAASVSKFSLSYLKEHLVHIEERDAELRPPFLEYFFKDTYTSNPQENSLCTLTKTLLKEHKTMMKGAIELNLLKGLHQTYSTLQALDKTTLLTDIVQKSFHLAIESVRQEEEAREHQGISPLTIEQRNLILTGEFQKKVIDFMLEISFPKGAEGLEIPEIISSKIPGVQTSMELIKTKIIWPLVQEGLQNLCKSIFVDLSTNETVKTQILIQGYSQAIAMLEKRPPPPSRSLDQFSKFSVFTIGIVSVFFRIIFNAFQKKSGSTFIYERQKQVNDDLYTTMEWFCKGSKPRELAFKLFGKRIIEGVGPFITDALKEIKLIDFLNQQLGSITESLTIKDKAKLFPRTKKDLQEIRKIQATEQKEYRDHLQNLRREFGANIDGLIYAATEAIYPLGDEKSLSKARVFLRHFFRATLFYLFRFLSWVSRVKHHVVTMEEKVFEAARRMEQDEVLMLTTAGGIKKLRSAKEKLPK